MPDVGFEAGIVLIMLLPGFISAKIVQLFCTASKRNEVEGITNALIHTFLVMVIYGICVGHMPIGVSVAIQDGKSHYDLAVNWGRLAVLLAVSVLWGIFAALCVNNDWPWKSLRNLNTKLRDGDKWPWNTRLLKKCSKATLTQRSARCSVWEDVFSEHGDTCYVQIELKDERIIYGSVRNYSPDPDTDDHPLFVSDASWITFDDEGKLKSNDPIPGPGIFLPESSEISNIVLLQAIIQEPAGDTEDMSILKLAANSSA